MSKLSKLNILLFLLLLPVGPLRSESGRWEGDDAAAPVTHAVTATIIFGELQVAAVCSTHRDA